MTQEKLSRCKRDVCEDAAPRKSAGDRIFESARNLFYRRGVRAVGVDEIVAEAGVTKPSLYRAYASKDDLIAACLAASVQECSDEVDAVMAHAPLDPRQRLEALLSFYAAKLCHPDYRGCPISNVAVEFPEPGHPARMVAEAAKADLRGRLFDLTRALGVCDPDALADGLMLLIEGAMVSRHLFGSQGPTSALLVSAHSLIAAHAGGMAGVQAGFLAQGEARAVQQPAP